jgi:hypothetical protein
MTVCLPEDSESLNVSNKHHDPWTGVCEEPRFLRPWLYNDPAKETEKHLKRNEAAVSDYNSPETAVENRRHEGVY